MNNHVFDTKQGTLKWVNECTCLLPQQEKGTNFDILQPRSKVLILL